MKKILLSLIFICPLIGINALASDPSRVNVIVQETCQHCHGIDGEASSIIYPRLAGQHQEYIVKQLRNFRSGERKGTMNALAANLTDEEIVALAEYFSQKSALSHRVHDEEFAAVGKYIFNNGNRYSGVAACASCHGESGAGTRSLPRLAGQHRRYVSLQLEDFESRKRTNDNAIMHSIASKLTDLERESVSMYVSGLE
jgi:cytochrome c553